MHKMERICDLCQRGKMPQTLIHMLGLARVSEIKAFLVHILCQSMDLLHADLPEIQPGWTLTMMSSHRRQVVCMCLSSIVPSPQCHLGSEDTWTAKLASVCNPLCFLAFSVLSLPSRKSTPSLLLTFTFFPCPSWRSQPWQAFCGRTQKNMRCNSILC